MLKGKHIVLGITGSIAAYKACLLVRALIKKGAEVQVVMTPSAKEFITPLTLSTLTHKPVISEFFDRRDGTWNSHVDLGIWADAMIIAPATASTIGKMAHGIADNMLITTYLSMKAPIFVAPAMDLDMYQHPITQKNLDLLRDCYVEIIEPGDGFLASGLEGKGRMEEPDKIVECLEEYFTPQDLYSHNILITAGPTYERLDPVRFIGNYSSGKMGFALAEECARRGAYVTLISGPVSLQTHSERIRRIDVESAQEMHDTAVEHFPAADTIILCAAVADFTPQTVADNKIKREAITEKDGEMVLHLCPTKDIAKELGEMKGENKLLVGFALETNDGVNNAAEKLQKKHLDMIVLNSLQDKGAGFKVDTNKISILTNDGRQDFPLKTKKEVAKDIVDEMAKRMPELPELELPF